MPLRGTRRAVMNQRKAGVHSKNERSKHYAMRGPHSRGTSFEADKCYLGNQAGVDPFHFSVNHDGTAFQRNKGRALFKKERIKGC